MGIYHEFSRFFSRSSSGHAPSKVTAFAVATALTCGACSSDDAAGTGTDAPDPDETPQALLCNGHEALCDRPYDEVVFAATHNAHSTLSADFHQVNANQTNSISQQLDDGVRCMALDIYEHEGDTALCHGPCTLGALSHRDTLNDLKSFLESNPHDVFTIIYEDHVGAELIEADFIETGLVDLVYTHTEGDTWPTLKEMIEAETRLVVTAESAGPPPAWLHHVWDVAWDTPYSYKSPEDFSCDRNRGSEGNDLYLMNHWVGTEAGLPSLDNAKLVNQSETLLARAQQCEAESGRVPNFIMVDFYEEGDLFTVVDTMNGF
jgi:hypothetical protein